MKIINRICLGLSRYKAGRILLHVIVAVRYARINQSLKGIAREF